MHLGGNKSTDFGLFIHKCIVGCDCKAALVGDLSLTIEMFDTGYSNETNFQDSPIQCFRGGHRLSFCTLVVHDVLGVLEQLTWMLCRRALMENSIHSLQSGSFRDLMRLSTLYVNGFSESHCICMVRELILRFATGGWEAVLLVSPESRGL